MVEHASRAHEQNNVTEQRWVKHVIGRDEPIPALRNGRAFVANPPKNHSASKNKAQVRPRVRGFLDIPLTERFAPALIQRARDLPAVSIGGVETRVVFAARKPGGNKY